MTIDGSGKIGPEIKAPTYSSFENPIDPTVARSAQRFLGAVAGQKMRRTKLAPEHTEADYYDAQRTPSVPLKAFLNGRIVLREVAAAADDLRRQVWRDVTERAFVSTHGFFFPGAAIQPGETAEAFAGALVTQYERQQERMQALSSATGNFSPHGSED